MGGISIIHWLVVIAILGIPIALVVFLLTRRKKPAAEGAGAAQVRDPAWHARTATILLWVWFATDVALALASLQQIGVLGGFGGPVAPQAKLETSDDLNTAVGIAYTLAFMVTGVVTLRWIYFVNRNAHVWCETMTVSPGWNVGWFFVPVANLWKPFVGVRETWQASFDPAVPESVAVPVVMRWWWGGWIITSALGNVTLRLALAADTIDGLILANWFYVVAIPIDLVVVLALTTVIRGLSQRQSEVIEMRDAEVTA